MSTVNIEFEDGVLEGLGEVSPESGVLVADGDNTVQHCDVVYLNLVWGVLYQRSDQTRLEPGAYLVCRRGLFRQVQIDTVEDVD